MSRDDAVFVLETKTANGSHEYRIACLSMNAIDNPHYNHQIGLITDKQQDEEVMNCFANSLVFHDKGNAMCAALELDNEWGTTEYGVRFLEMNLVFPYPPMGVSNSTSVHWNEYGMLG